MDNNPLFQIEMMVGSLVKLQTLDGIYMKGKLTGFETYSFKANGVDQFVLRAVVLDNDPEKKIETTRLETIEEL